MNEVPTTIAVNQPVIIFGIEAQNLCNSGDIPAAKETFLQMLGHVRENDDAHFCLIVFHDIKRTAENLNDQPEKLFDIYVDLISREPVQIKRAKLVLDAAMMLELVQVQKIFQLKMVRTLHPKIKEKFFVPELTEEPIFEEVLLPILRVSVGTRTEKIGEFPKSKKFVID